MNDVMLSVIIPAYNADKRIIECLDSIKHQDYKKIEIIIINDGSTDGTKDILDKYDFGEFKHIIVNKINEGVSKARNEGIKLSTGDYILFLDSDDTLEPKIMSKIMERINSTIDVVKVSYYLEYKNKKVPVNDKMTEGIITKNEINKLIIDLIVGDSNGFSSLFIVRRNLLVTNEIAYPENIRYMEDLIFVIKMLEKSNCIDISNEKLLNYYQSNSSVSKSIDIDKRIEGIDNRYNYCIKYFEKEDYIDYKDKFINMIVSMYLKTEKYIFSKNVDVKKYNEIINNRINKILNNNKVKLNLKNRILIFFTKHKLYVIIHFLVLMYNVTNKVRGVENYD